MKPWEDYLKGAVSPRFGGMVAGQEHGQEFVDISTIQFPDPRALQPYLHRVLSGFVTVKDFADANLGWGPDGTQDGANLTRGFWDGFNIGFYAVVLHAYNQAVKDARKRSKK